MTGNGMADMVLLVFGFTFIFTLMKRNGCFESSND